MKFNPDIFTRVKNGDLDALDALVEFDDGTVRRLAECDSCDVEVMKAYAVYKSAENRIRMGQFHEQLRKHKLLLETVGDAS